MLNQVQHDILLDLHVRDKFSDFWSQNLKYCLFGQEIGLIPYSVFG